MPIKQTIRDNLINSISVATQVEYKEYLEYFTDVVNQSERLSLYKDIKTKHNFENEAEAKLHLLKTTFSSYISDRIDKAQNICEDNIDEANKIIGEIKEIKDLFKDYDVLSFKEYLCSVVPNINIDEVNAVFEKEKFTLGDVKTISKAIEGIFSREPTTTYNDYSLAFNNHELTSLLSISRKKSVIFNPDNFSKYAELANALIEFRKQEHVEGFDGAVVLLIDMDIRIGLQNIISPPELVKILDKIKSKTFEKNDVYELMRVAVLESKNFEDDGFGGITYINNTGDSFRLKGVADRCYNDTTLMHSVSKREFQQVGRAIQLKTKELVKKDNKLPVSIQIAEKPAISRQLAEFGLSENLTSREQLILSYANNFSYLLLAVANNEFSEQIFSQGPIEIYTDCHKQSQRFMNEFLSYDNKIIDFVQSYINVLEKTKVLSVENSTFGEDRKHVHLLRPLKSIANALLDLYDENQDKYGQTISNISHFLMRNEKTLLTGNMETVSDFKSLLRNLKRLNLLEETKPDTSFLEIKYPEDAQSLTDIITSSKSQQSKRLDLIVYFEENIDKLSFSSFTSDELKLIRGLDEDTKQPLLPIFNLMARSDFEAIPYKGRGRPQKLDIIYPVIDKLTHKNKDDRRFYGNGTNTNYSTPSQIKIYNLYYKDWKNGYYEQLEILETLAYMSNGKLTANYRLNNINQEKLNARLKM